MRERNSRSPYVCFRPHEWDGYSLNPQLSLHWHLTSDFSSCRWNGCHCLVSVSSSIWKSTISIALVFVEKWVFMGFANLHSPFPYFSSIMYFNNFTSSLEMVQFCLLFRKLRLIYLLRGFHLSFGLSDIQVMQAKFGIFHFLKFSNQLQIFSSQF